MSPPILDKFTLIVLNKLSFIQRINDNTIFPFLFATVFVVDFSLFKRGIRLVSISHLTLWLIYLIGFKSTFGDVFLQYADSQLSISTTNYPFHAMNALFGGLFIFLILNLIIFLYFKNQRCDAGKVFLSFSWPFIFIFITYFFTPRTFAFETFLSFPIELQESYVHYYFIPALGVYFLISYLSFCLYPKTLKVKNKKYLRLIPVVLLTILVVANAFSVKAWADGRMRYRSAKTLNSVSHAINSEIQAHYSIARRPIVYFTSIDDVKDFFHYAVT